MMFPVNGVKSQSNKGRIKKIKNYYSEFQSDPDTLQQLINPLKDKKNEIKPEEYLSFSETSDDYEYYFYKVRKGQTENLKEK